MGVRWKVGDGPYASTIRFWEDVWVGNCCLGTQFWDLYILADQKNVSLASVWKGNELIFSFMKRVDHGLIRMWEELITLVELVRFENYCDAIIWSFQENGQFSLQSMYKLVLEVSNWFTPKPANGLDNNGFNNLDFVLGLFRLGAKWASVKTNWFGLGSSTQQFGANWVPI